MLKIYGRKNSNQVIQTMWAVGEMSIEHIRYNVGGSFGGTDTQEYANINPNQLVPTIDDNGYILWESYTIIRYLCRQYGLGTLWPEDSRQVGIADQWMEWTNSRFMGTFFPVFWSLIRTPKEEQDQQKIAAAAESTALLLNIVESNLQGKRFMVGDSLTMGDIPLGSMMFKYFNLDIQRPIFPNIEAWYQRLCDRNAYQTHCMNSFGRNSEEWIALEKAEA